MDPMEFKQYFVLHSYGNIAIPQGFSIMFIRLEASRKPAGNEGTLIFLRKTNLFSCII